MNPSTALSILFLAALVSCSSATTSSSNNNSSGTSDGGGVSTSSSTVLGCCADPSAMQFKGSKSGVYCKLTQDVAITSKEGRPCFFTTAAAMTSWSSLELTSCDGYVDPQPCVRASQLPSGAQCCADQDAVSSKGATGQACLNPPGHGCTINGNSAQAEDCTTWAIPTQQNATGLSIKTCW